MYSQRRQVMEIRISLYKLDYLVIGGHNLVGNGDQYWVILHVYTKSFLALTISCR